MTANLTTQLSREPSLKEVADTLGVELAYLRRLTLLLKNYSIEQPMCETNQLLGDSIEDTMAWLFPSGGTVPWLPPG